MSMKGGTFRKLASYVLAAASAVSCAGCGNHYHRLGNDFVPREANGAYAEPAFRIGGFGVYPAIGPADDVAADGRAASFTPAHGTGR